MEKLRHRMIAKGAKHGDLIFPNSGVEGHFLRKLQAIAERAGVRNRNFTDSENPTQTPWLMRACPCPRS
jgi:hypothetical protein